MFFVLGIMLRGKIIVENGQILAEVWSLKLDAWISQTVQLKIDIWLWKISWVMIIHWILDKIWSSNKDVIKENGFLGPWNLFLLPRFRHMLCCKLSSLCHFWPNCWNDWPRRLLLLWMPCFHSLLEYFLAMSAKRNHTRKRRHSG